MMRLPILSTSPLRALTCAAMILAILSSASRAQLRSFGLTGDTVYSLRLYGTKLYAGTERGAFVREVFSSDSSWTPIGLRGKRIRAIYPHNYGPIGYAVTAGLEHRSGDADSALTYCTFSSDTSWAPTDSGMDRTRFHYVGSADGFPSPTVCGETFATTAGALYRRGGVVWELVLDPGAVKFNVVRTRETGLTTGMVYVGGETAIFSPFIKYSIDKGETWEDAKLPYHGDDACYAFAFDPADTSRIYAGMEGSVLLSTDGGRAWSTSGLSGTSFYFFALGADLQNVYAGGAASTGPGRFGLYRSIDKGANWAPLSITDSLAGVLSLETIPTKDPEVNALIVGTLGSGVLIYGEAPVSAPPSRPPLRFELQQAYPNPFNPSTMLSFQLPEVGQVHLVVYDILGHEVAVLAHGRMAPGVHQVRFNASGLGSGIYLYRLRAGSFVQTRKMVLVH